MAHVRPPHRRAPVAVTRRARAGIAAAGLLALLAVPGRAVARDEIEILVHHAYGDPRRFTLEGRVAERHDVSPAGDKDSWLANLWRSLRSLRVEEEKDVPLRVSLAGRSWEVRSDHEGYFSLGAETPPLATPGWNLLRLETARGIASTDAEALIVPPGDTLGIISDFDDTVIVSEVPDRSRLARNTLLQNYLQRRPVAGMAALYRDIVARNPVPAAAPVIYLTASPRQLRPTIAAFLERNGFPRGPIVAKKITDGGGDPLLDQERYKLQWIERIFADLPGVRFVLAGDDGERDPEVYDVVRTRHRARVEAVYIRKVSSDPSRPTFPGQTSPPLPDPPPTGGSRRP